jgi:hypothetical protein
METADYCEFKLPLIHMALKIFCYSNTLLSDKHSLRFSCLGVTIIFKMVGQVITEHLHARNTEDRSTSSDMSRKQYCRMSAESQNSLTRRDVRY